MTPFDAWADKWAARVLAPVLVAVFLFVWLWVAPMSRPLLWPLFLLAVLVAFAQLARALAAPVPAGPKELTTELLAGTWHYEYGTMWLYADGTYCARHEPGGSVFTGDWRADGNALVIYEWYYNPELGRQGGPNTYRFTFDLSRFPHLAGQSHAGTRVVLSSPKR